MHTTAPAASAKSLISNNPVYFADDFPAVQQQDNVPHDPHETADEVAICEQDGPFEYSQAAAPSTFNSKSLHLSTDLHASTWFYSSNSWIPKLETFADKLEASGISMGSLRPNGNHLLPMSGKLKF